MTTCVQALNQLANYIEEARQNIDAGRLSGDYNYEGANPLEVYFIAAGVESAERSAGNMIDLIEDAKQVICAEELESGGTSNFLNRYTSRINRY